MSDKEIGRNSESKFFVEYPPKSEYEWLIPADLTAIDRRILYSNFVALEPSLIPENLLHIKGLNEEVIQTSILLDYSHRVSVQEDPNYPKINIVSSNGKKIDGISPCHIELGRLPELENVIIFSRLSIVDNWIYEFGRDRVIGMTNKFLNSMNRINIPVIKY